MAVITNSRGLLRPGISADSLDNDKKILLVDIKPEYLKCQYHHHKFVEFISIRLIVSWRNAIFLFKFSAKVFLILIAHHISNFVNSIFLFKQ